MLENKKPDTSFRDYEVWHDECKKHGYCHGVLLIPIDRKVEILSILKEIRSEHKFSNNDNIKFSGCLKKLRVGKLVSNNLALFSHIVQTKPKGVTRLFNRTGEKIYTKDFDPFLRVTGSFGCRFGFLKIRELEDSLNYFSNYRNKVETTFRFVVKACCHGMFDEKTPINLAKLYFDGNEHYQGDLNIERLTRGEWRLYCKISDCLSIDDRGIKERDEETKLIMNFVDNIVGAWSALLSNEKDPYNVLYPLKEIRSRLCDNIILKNRNSRWYKAVSFSEFRVINGELMFPSLFRNEKQLNLF